ncbi:MAG TPA: methyltransferase domain-containing protein [Dehalococcoidia bacterium]
MNDAQGEKVDTGQAASNTSMPDLLSAALFEHDGAVLTAHRSSARPPFAGQWLLPMTPVRSDETAEEALVRHARDQFGIDVSGESFVDTVYMEDPDDKRRYVANIFRARLGEGPMRFRADGDYDDARWLAAGELADVWMPPALREPLVRILTAPPDEYENVWSEEQGGALPLGEQAPATASGTAAPPVPAPDNHEGWNAIAAAYQAERYGDRDVGRLKWSRGVFEDELRLLDDVRGKRAIVLGCGGGQDVVALERMGAVAVGVDISEEQITYAKKYAARHGAENSSFVVGSMDDLTRFDDASFDAAVSIHALAYVTDLERALFEAARVLKPGATLAIAVPHPLNQVAGDDPPYGVVRSYWADVLDWEFELEGASAHFRERTPSVSQWFSLLTDAGFTVERIAEPYLGDLTGDDAKGFDMRKAQLLPYVMIIKARKR